MSVMAVFGCSKCGCESIHGYHKGKEAPAPPPEFPCMKCKAKTVHSFLTYITIDERSDAERMRQRLQVGI
jgi:hypothetical protein